MKVKSESEVAQSCPTLCDPMDCSLPGSSVCGILEYWSRFPFPSPGDLPNPAIEPQSSALQADAYKMLHYDAKKSPEIPFPK